MGPEAPELSRWLQELALAGVSVVGFSGGEPLLRDDLEQAMVSGLNSGLKGFGVATNGALLTPARARSLARSGLTSAQVSVDGLTPEDHCSVRGCRPGDYFSALRAIRLFREAGVSTDMAVLLNRRNLERLPEFALLAESLGVNQLRWCSYVPTGRGASLAQRGIHEPAHDRLDVFLDLVRRLNAVPEPPVRITIDHGIGPFVEDGTFQCQAGRSIAYVSSSGDVYPCPALLFPQFRTGNLYETPLHKLLADSKLPFSHRALKHRGMCATCTNSGCSGGCRGTSYAFSGEFLDSPPYCNVTRRAGSGRVTTP